jgi:hypothetical protein
MNVERSRVMPFDIGTSVVVSNGNHYRYTKPGSEGIIIGVTDDGLEYLIEFTHLTGIQPRENEDVRFWINAEHLEILEKNLDVSSPYYKINRKVKQMYRRRKEQGYAF